MNAAIYLRVSTADQKDGASLATQRADCTRFAEARGMVVASEYLDIQSGLKSDRKQYQAMLGDAREGQFQRIIIWKMDRFGRDRIESGYQLRELQRVGVQVDSATEPNDSPLLRNILMDFAEEESRRISQRVTANRQTRSRDGKRTSRAPFGYRNVPHPETGVTMEPSEDAQVVTEAFRRYSTGRATLLDLVEYIGEASAAPNKPATRQGVHNLLRNPVYLGQIQHGKWARDSAVSVISKAERQAASFTCQGKHPALVDESTFQACQEIMASHKSRKHAAPHSPFLFVGLIRCGQCGSRYTGHRNGGHSKQNGYYCTAKNRRGNGHCSNPGVAEIKLRKAVIEPLTYFIREHQLPEARAAMLAKDSELVERQRKQESAGKDGLSEELARLEKRLSGFEDSLADGLMDRERFIEHRDKLLPQIQALKEQLSAAPAKVVTAAPLLQALDTLEVDSEGQLTKAGQPLDIQDWRYLLSMTLEGIVIKDGMPEITWKEYIDFP